MTQYDATTTAKHRKAIVLCCDKGFLKFAAFVATQIFDLHPEPDFDVCICSHEALELPATLQSLPVRLCHLPLPDVLEDAPQSYRINLSSYLRLFVPQAFSADYDRILYLDSDIFLRGGDLSKLLDTELLDDHPVAAVRTSHQRDNQLKQMPEFKALGQTPAPYFNAGILLIDVPRWDASDILPKALDLMKTQPDVLNMHDQSVLNIVLRDNWSELSVAWNWMYSGRFSYLLESCDPFILHFAGRIKPWNRLNGEFPPKYPEVYRAFFAKHYPEEAEKMPPAASIFAAQKFHKKSLLKQWWDFNGLARYISRFDDPYVAIDPRS